MGKSAHLKRIMFECLGAKGEKPSGWSDTSWHSRNEVVIPTTPQAGVGKTRTIWRGT